MAIKDDKLVVKINSDEKDEITETAERLDIPVSQFMREAAREKIASIKQQETEAAGAAASVNG